ncbi:MAG: hypothetical protein U0570_05430 [Phycisphaerales bacterium]
MVLIDVVATLVLQGWEQRLPPQRDKERQVYPRVSKTRVLYRLKSLAQSPVARSKNRKNPGIHDRNRAHAPAPREQKTMPKKKPAICLLGQSRALGWGLVENEPDSNTHVVGDFMGPV